MNRTAWLLLAGAVVFYFWYQRSVTAVSAPSGSAGTSTTTLSPYVAAPSAGELGLAPITGDPVGVIGVPDWSTVGNQ